MLMRNIYIQVTLLTICIKTFQITCIAHLPITLLYILILVCLITKAGLSIVISKCYMCCRTSSLPVADLELFYRGCQISIEYILNSFKHCLGLGCGVVVR